MQVEEVISFHILFQNVATSTSSTAAEVLGTEYGPDLFKRLCEVARNNILNPHT